jgi:hypothetical protein
MIKDKINRNIIIIFAIIIIIEVFNNEQADKFVNYIFMDVFYNIIKTLTNSSNFKIALTGLCAYIVKLSFNKIKKWFDKKIK